MDLRQAESPPMNKKYNLHVSLEPNEMRNSGQCAINPR